MCELAGRRATNLDRRVVEPLAENPRTLREHYRRKRARYEIDTARSYDRPLLRVFAQRGERPHGRLASACCARCGRSCAACWYAASACTPTLRTT